MKSALKVLSLVMICFTLAGFQATPQSSWNEDKLIIEFSEYYDGARDQWYPLELVYNQTSRRVMLRVRIDDERQGTHFGVADGALGFLKRLVENYATYPEETWLPLNEFSFRFTGGYPIWAPSHLFTQDASYVTLLFAEEAVLEGMEIQAQGRDSVVGYYPYSIAR